tara:strand:- start:136 stop:885 length:750 start_codon:yes stop_codon:yes gene_type:complete
MHYKLITIILILIFITGCEQINYKDSNLSFEKKYKNSGFTLIYNDKMSHIKKLDTRSLDIFHKSLKNKSLIKITNPENGKSIIAQVKSNKVEFSEFYNSVISSRIAETLELDMSLPFIEIVLITKNSTFVAKKAKTFDEERNVAEKAPIDGITVNDLNKKQIDTKKKKDQKKVFSYSIKIADFYYEDTAKMMLDRIISETSLKNSKIHQLSKTKFRVIIGPFNDIKTLKESFEKMKSLNFENLEILKNV